MKTYVYYIGKPRDPHVNALADEYLKRIQRFGKCEMREIRPERFELWLQHPTGLKVLLDPDGTTRDAQAVSKLLERVEREGRDLVFVVGGAEGFPNGWREHSDVLLSLSPMTFPHELARALLLEQIYRAYTLLRGHPYPK